MNTRDTLETPVAVVNLDRLEANIARFQQYCDQHQIANWPHSKTHKIPAIAAMQRAAGAAGICCQKLSEAEVMADAGFDQICIPYNLLGEQRLARLANLMQRATLTVSADSAETVAGLGHAARLAGRTLAVLVECDIGGQRCGVQNPEEAAALARTIAATPGLAFAGLLAYPLAPPLEAFVAGTRAILAADGISVGRVSAGSTAGMWQIHEYPSVGEYRAGMYIYGDRGTIARGAIAQQECALHVIATVVSRPTPTRAVLDAGSKALSSDISGLAGYGLILEYPDALIEKLSEEHAHVDLGSSARTPQIGERVTILPNHCCPVSNLFDQIVGLRGDAVEVIWPVAARGKLV
jgi:D-serine deaminase-like pyridoxal phosphate-dependent protein